MSQSIQLIREILIGNAVASETTLATFQDTASALELAVVSADGTAPGAGKPFFLVGKASDGSVIKSDIIYPDNVKRVDVLPFVAEVPKAVTVSDITVPDTGESEEYIVTIRLINVGSLSPDNFHLFHGHTKFTKTASNSAEDVVSALITNLNQNFSIVPGATSTTNPLFTFGTAHNTQTLTVTTAPTADGTATVTINGDAIDVALLDADTDAGAATKIAAAIDAEDDYAATATGADVEITATGGEPVSTTYDGGTSGSEATIDGTDAEAALVITAKSQPYEAGKKFARPLEFDVTFDAGDETATVEVSTAPHPGRGTGKKVAEMEWFLRGFRGDQYRGQHFPYNWNTSTKTLSDPDGTYNTVEVAHFINGDGMNEIKMPKELTIAVDEDPGTTTVADSLETNIEVFTGAI